MERTAESVVFPSRSLEEFELARPREIARLAQRARLERPLMLFSILVALGVLAAEFGIGMLCFQGRLSPEMGGNLMYLAAGVAVGLYFVGVWIITYFNNATERRIRLQEDHRALMRDTQS